MDVPQAVSAAWLPSVTAEPSRVFIPRTWIVPTQTSYSHSTRASPGGSSFASSSARVPSASIRST